MLDKIVLIHPTKCAGTSISQELLKLKGFSDRDSDFYSGYSFNRFFQKNISFFYFIIHSRNIILYLVYLLFYLICFFQTLVNLFRKQQFGLTYKRGSYQHFTYREWKQVNRIQDDSVSVCVVTHPQHRIVSSYYFLGYDQHYTFLEFLEKIKDGSLLSSIRFSGFRALIQQHVRLMHDSIIDNKKEIQVDFILKTESLNDDWKSFCHTHKLAYRSLKHLNRTKPIKNWKSLYKIFPRASQLVYEIYQKDFECFGYTLLR